MKLFFLTWKINVSIHGLDVVVIPMAVSKEIMEVLLALASHFTSQKDNPSKDINGSFRIQKSNLSSDSSTSIVLVLPRQTGVPSSVSAAAAERTRNWSERVSEHKHRNKMHPWNKGLLPKHREQQILLPPTVDTILKFCVLLNIVTDEPEEGKVFFLQHLVSSKAPRNRQIPNLRGHTRFHVEFWKAHRPLGICSSSKSI